MSRGTVKVAAVLSGIGLIGVVVVLLSTRSPQSSEGRLENDQRGVAKDRRHGATEDLRRQIQGLKIQVTALQIRGSRGLSREKATGKPAEDQPGEDDATSSQRIEQTYSDAFSQQPIDSTWSASQERDVSGYLQRKEAEFPGCCSVVSVKCRTSMCKTVVDHDNQDAYHVFLKSVKNRPFESAHHIRVSDDFRRSTIYSARVGHSFPLVTPPRL